MAGPAGTAWATGAQARAAARAAVATVTDLRTRNTGFSIRLLKILRWLCSNRALTIIRVLMIVNPRILQAVNMQE
ncbi:hypothetical protein GCM10010140_22750 [Streptosporangium pseudovulgare]|uniref:Uncharacterized protein n=1 Tax=Streptosporangium pseudovulgare TaxID=35765 RepID=A0ABQ2QQA7_9ACTN|nr:hypothetical protein GCM10010140_22750 [Streptosporangium pseudovulgare]